MIGSPVARHTLVRRRAAAQGNSQGVPVRNWAEAVDTPLTGWALDAGDTSEDGEGRPGVVLRWTARGPLGADVEETDRVLVDGVEYQIDGGVVRVPGPISAVSHTRLRLRLVKG